MEPDQTYRLLCTGTPDEIIRAFLPLVKNRASRYARQSPVHYDDLYTIGLSSVHRASQTFNPKYCFNGAQWIATKVESDMRRHCKRVRDHLKDTTPVVSLNQPVDDEDCDSDQLQDLIPDQQSPTPEQELMDAQREHYIKTVLQRCMEDLTEREASVVRALWIIPTGRPNRSGVAESMGISIYTLNKLASRARAKMLRSLQETGINPGELFNEA